MAANPPPPSGPLGPSPQLGSAAAALNAAFGTQPMEELGAPGPRPGGGPRSGKGKSKKTPPRKRRSIGFSLLNLRLLPVTIFVAALMLSVRVTDVWRGLSSMELGPLSLNQSEAQQPPPPGGRKRGQQGPQTPDNAAPAASTAPATPTAPAGAAPAAPPTQSAAAPPAAKDPAAPPAVPSAGASEGEPPTFTQNEIDVLQKLSERREALDSRERDLNLRENLVKAAEARIDKKIAEMKSLQVNVESMLKQVDEQDDAKMKSLTKIYETMKPKDAAKIFEQLDLPILLGVLNKMKEQKIAPIMEAMDPMRAKTLTDAMAQRRAAKAEGQTN
jgi:flagellar motility protein MotE (MotC chaperone)